MKRSIWAVLGAGILLAAVFSMRRPQVLSAPAAEPATEPATVSATEVPSTEPPMVAASEPSPPPALQSAQPTQGTEPAPASPKATWEAAVFHQTIELLVSSQTPYGQKQSVWKQLGDAGELDRVISNLEQRIAADPQAAEYPATLGQAYLKKCATLQDVREQGILAIQADKLFDKALTRDPANWEARFTKAVALSYWPPSMNKGD